MLCEEAELLCITYLSRLVHKTLNKMHACQVIFNNLTETEKSSGEDSRHLMIIVFTRRARWAGFSLHVHL